MFILKYLLFGILGAISSDGLVNLVADVVHPKMYIEDFITIELGCDLLGFILGIVVCALWPHRNPK